MSNVRILEGIISNLRTYSGQYAGRQIEFNLGNPPERITMSGRSTFLTEGEYLVVAVKPGIISRLFPNRAWARRDAALAYSSMNLRGEIRTVGYVCTVLCNLLCACGFVYSFMIARGLVPSGFTPGDLTPSGWTLMPQSPDRAAALIALVSSAFGLVGVSRLRATRDAVSALSTNSTVQQAQERSTI
jgi:hypothetical protein